MHCQKFVYIWLIRGWIRAGVDKNYIMLQVKGSPVRINSCSDPKFGSSILCDMIETSWWLMSRSTQNWLKMKSYMIRIVLCWRRSDPTLISKVERILSWFTLKIVLLNDYLDWSNRWSDRMCIFVWNSMNYHTEVLLIHLTMPVSEVRKPSQSKWMLVTDVGDNDIKNILSRS